MDSFQHSAWGLAIGTHFNLPIEQSIAISVVSVSPDVIGFVGLKTVGTWEPYLVAHSWDTVAYLSVATIALMLGFHTALPLFCWAGYALHVLLDSFTHKSGREWWVWCGGFLWAEILGWLLLIWYFAWHLAK